MAGAIIKAKNLRKSYRGVVAVDDVSFEIQEGEVFGFLGPNGAGKTTIMKMIYCFVLPDSGLLEVDGLDVVRWPRQVKRLLGVVHQEDSLDPDLTVRENLIAYARFFDIPKRESTRRADELIEMMSLTEKRDTVIDELSGGMKRRLMIIRGLINSPRILILDEPTTGLDPQARHLVWQKLRTLKKSGITIVLTTHYMDEAEQLCDRIAMLNEGKIIAVGSPQELVAQFAAREVIKLRDLDPAEWEKLPLLLGGDGVWERFEDTIYIYTNDAAGILPKIDGLIFAAMERRRTNLEDVFLRLAGRTLKE